MQGMPLVRLPSTMSLRGRNLVLTTVNHIYQGGGLKRKSFLSKNSHLPMQAKVSIFFQQCLAYSCIQNRDQIRLIGNLIL